MARSAVALEPGVFAHRLTLDAALVAAAREEEAATLEASLDREALADTRALRQLSRHYYDRTGRSAKADALLVRAIESHPGDPDVMDARARYLWSEKRYDEAERLFRAALEARPASADLMNSLSYMNAERGVKLEEALTLIDRALAQSPDYATYLDSKGWVLYRLGRLDGAWTCLARAVALRHDPEILDHLGDVEMARGRKSEARDAWRRAVERDDATSELRARVQQKLDGSDTGPQR
jgi:Tfp pilus assembly protein PilF